jgi:hypothetical protein
MNLEDHAGKSRIIDERILRKMRPGLLSRAMARLLLAAGVKTNWAITVHAREVEHRALRSVLSETDGHLDVADGPVTLSHGTVIKRTTDDP